MSNVGPCHCYSVCSIAPMCGCECDVCLCVCGDGQLYRCWADHRRLTRHRLPKRALDSLPVAKFDKAVHTAYDTCAICLDDYEEGEQLRILPCNHGNSSTAPPTRYRGSCGEGAEKQLLSPSRSSEKVTRTLRLGTMPPVNKLFDVQCPLGFMGDEDLSIPIGPRYVTHPRKCLEFAAVC